jgi:hypothetical protein
MFNGHRNVYTEIYKSENQNKSYKLMLHWFCIQRYSANSEAMKECKISEAIGSTELAQSYKGNARTGAGAGIFWRAGGGAGTAPQHK